MIVVMDNMNAVQPGEDGSIFAGRGLVPAPRPEPPTRGPGRALGGPGGGLASFTGATFTEMMLTDLILTIERTYRVLPGRENRAMAGLSMGGMQTFLPNALRGQRIMLIWIVARNVPGRLYRLPVRIRLTATPFHGFPVRVGMPSSFIRVTDPPIPWRAGW